MNPPETYLGDGLYASFNGQELRLRAPRAEGDHFVALDSYILENLFTFLKANGVKIR